MDYCVGLGNEGGGKLILGVSEGIPRKITGSSALADLNDVKSKIFQKLEMRIKATEVFDEKSNRIVVIEIPSREKGSRFKFYGVPLMRVGEELIEMDSITETRILNEIKPDWSGEIRINATVDDLAPEAISVARNNFKRKNPNLNTEVDSWDDQTFLNKAKLAIKGRITNAAIILLGKEESSTLISPAVVQMSWILKTKDGIEKDYEHFSCPFLLSVENLYKKIRNLKYRYMKNPALTHGVSSPSSCLRQVRAPRGKPSSTGSRPWFSVSRVIKDGTLFPEEVDMYDPFVIREALHNCIAHQDYSLHGRIQVIENEEGYLLFTNKGHFLPGTIENVIEADSPQEYYQNRFLVDAMVNLNMIDTIGSGIKRMFSLQKEKFRSLSSGC